MCPSRFLFVLMNFNLSLCVLLGLYTFLWVLMGPYKSLCVLIHSNGSL